MSAPGRRAVAALFGMLLLLIPLAGTAQQTFRTAEATIVTATGVEHRVEVEMATTPDQRAQGLMHRETMAPDAGMLFVYEREQRIAMWMKNTLLPLDMLFIAADGTIESIEKRTVPGSLRPVRSRGDVLGVLELNAGAADRLGIRPGDRLLHPAFGG